MKTALCPFIKGTFSNINSAILPPLCPEVTGRQLRVGYEHSDFTDIGGTRGKHGGILKNKSTP